MFHKTDAQKKKHIVVQNQVSELEILRTANAGVLLKTDEISVLLDGVCDKFNAYLGTPIEIRDYILKNPLDCVGVTHMHPDHYDEEFVNQYKKQKNGPVFGPWSDEKIIVNGVEINVLKTKHIGKFQIEHTSFIINTNKCVWFLGDASPICLRHREDLPKPDILIVPYAYAITDTAWKIAKNFNPKSIILLHLPSKEDDENDLWKMVEETTKNDSILLIPKIGETIKF